MQNQSTTALIILDGFGLSDRKEFNAIYSANTPNLDYLMNNYPNSKISGSGLDVGLPKGQMGNSEVGHMNIGAGRIVYQDYTRISQSIKCGDFYSNSILTQLVDKITSKNSTLHILGLLSTGGVHSHEKHIEAMIDLAYQRGLKKVSLHAFLDGRDTAPRSAESSLLFFDQKLTKLKIGGVVSIIGRYYAMDRDNRWDRIQKTYDLLTLGKGDFQCENVQQALYDAYGREESDEFVKASVINSSEGVIENGDGIIFMNFRSDRARQLTQAFVDHNFKGFIRKKIPELIDFVTLTKYSDQLNTTCVFPSFTLINTLGEVLEKKNKHQLRIAETEKYAHVTFFFSCGHEQTFKNENRILVQSPQVATYSMQPEMSAFEMTNRLVKEIHTQKYDLIVCNFANCDMVGHTGDFNATVKAVETVDDCVGKIIESLSLINGQCLITADHGNAEQMVDSTTGAPHTAHTCEKVPLIYYGKHVLNIKDGKLSDIAPTILELMKIDKPEEMTGISLVKIEK